MTFFIATTCGHIATILSCDDDSCCSYKNGNIFDVVAISIKNAYSYNIVLIATT